MRGIKRLLLAGAFSCHLALVVAGALHLTSRLHGPVGRGLRFYDELSGAGDSYSFFAPAVGPQLRARFTLSTPWGERFEETLETGKNREVGFRVGNLAGTGPADLGSVLETEEGRASEALRSAQLRCGRSRGGLDPREHQRAELRQARKLCG
jgi:hypothetical protein